MNKKIYLMLNTSFFPLKDMDTYDDTLLKEVFLDTQGIGLKRSKDVIKTNTHQFNELVHTNILKKCKANSLDEINLIMKKYHPFLYRKDCCYTEEKHLYQHYFKIIDDFAKAFISHRDGEIVYKYWKNDKDKDTLGPYNETEKVHVFSSLSRLIPLDILIASYFAQNGITEPIYLNNVYHHINLADAPLDDILKKGVSENHLHASSAYNFGTLWFFAMNGQLSESFLKEFQSGYNFNQKYCMQDMIAMATLIRLIMSMFLADQYADNIIMWLKDGLEACSDYNVHSGLEKFNRIREIIFEDKEIRKASEIMLLIDEIKVDMNIVRDENNLDFIFSIFHGVSHINTYGENIFLQQVYKYRSEHGEDDEKFSIFSALFFKYLRIKNEFYQQVTQASTIKGLDFFKRYFDRATKGPQKGTVEYYRYLLRALFQDSYLKKVELRMGIHSEVEANKVRIKNILNAYLTIIKEDYDKDSNRDGIIPRIGIVYHLIKVDDNIDKCWCIYDEESNITGNRIASKSIQAGYLGKTEMIAKLREKVPYLSHLIIGLDAASKENSTPVQVFAPVYDVARDSSKDSLMFDNGKGKLAKTQSLFFTFHAGEDFRHILSGLRRMDEVIDNCKLHSGDRIGHGIALGVHIPKWVKDNPVVIMPRKEYLDNLLWVWGVYTQHQVTNPQAIIYLENKIYQVAKEIFDSMNGLTTPILYEVYQQRFSLFNSDLLQDYDKEILKEKEDETNKSGDSIALKNTIKTFCPEAPSEGVLIWDVNKLILAYNCRCFLERMDEPIYIDTSGIEEEIATDIQNYLITKVGQKGIVIESNPTSNFAIGEVESLFDNQLFKINRAKDEELSNVMVSINSDNPLVFNTNVSNEIAFMYYGMLNQGVSKEVALAWIDKVRQTGMDTSFIRNVMSDREYIQAMEIVYEELGGMLD